MSLREMTTDFTGQVSVYPRIIRLNTDDSYSTITTAGYLNQYQQVGYSFYANDIVAASYGSSQETQFFYLSISNGTITLLPMNITTNGDVGQVVTYTNTSATPSTTRAITGKMVSTPTTQTGTGNLVGVRGEVDYVGASAGFFYGTQGKIIPTGTLSGSSWSAGLFGQLDVHGATINAGQVAAVWGDWGATGATATDLTGCRGFAFTNTTSNVLNAQDYRYGNATYLMELAGAGGTLNYYLDAGTGSGSAGNSTHCAAQKVIKIVINSSAAYIPVFTQNS